LVHRGVVTADGLHLQYCHGRSGERDGAFFVVAAADGCPALPRLAARDVYAWHAPPCAPNTALRACKYHARLDLAFSSTVPVAGSDDTAATAVVPDVTGEEAGGTATLAGAPGDVASTVMTDGAGLASVAAMDAAAAAVVAGGIPAAGRALTPPAVQGRLGGYKGTWVVHPGLAGRQLLHRPSMAKLAQPTPTRSQLTWEVRRVASTSGAASLNTQILALLLGWGVPLATLLELQAHALATLTAAPTRFVGFWLCVRPGCVA